MNCHPPIWMYNPTFYRILRERSRSTNAPSRLRGIRGVRRVAREWKERVSEPWDCTTRIKPSTTASGWHTAKASTLQKTRGKQRRSTTSQTTSNLGIFHWSQGHVNMTQAKHAVRTTTGLPGHQPFTHWLDTPIGWCPLWNPRCLRHPSAYEFPGWWTSPGWWISQ
jgi:hypothetical protein